MRNIETISCPACGASIKAIRLQGHLRRVHNPAAEERRRQREQEQKEQRIATARVKDELVTCKVCNKQVQRKNINSHKATEHKIFAKLKVQSSECMRGRVTRHCTSCGKPTDRPWIYNLSSRDPVYLCSKCKPAVLSRSFGRNAILNSKMISSGFETSRRRH